MPTRTILLRSKDSCQWTPTSRLGEYSLRLPESFSRIRGARILSFSGFDPSELADYVQMPPSGGSSGPTIYSGDDTLSGARVVSGSDLNNLTFSAIPQLSLNSPAVTLGVVPSTSNTENGLLVRNSTSGVIELRDVSTLPAPPLNVNIYNDDGVVISDRVIDGNARTIEFDNFTRFDIDAPTVRLIRSPDTSNTDTFFLTRNVLTGAIQLREISTLPQSENVYNTNGVLTNSRVIGGDNSNHSLSIVEISDFTVGALTVTLSVAPPTTTTDEFVLTRDVVSGRIRVRDISTIGGSGGGDNIYNANGTVTGTRTVSGNGNSLTFSGFSNIFLGASNAVVLSTAPFENNAQTLLLAYNGTNGRIERRTVASLPNLFNINGSLTGNRVLGGSGFNLNFSSLGVYTIGSAEFNLTTPSMRLVTAPALNNGATELLARDTANGNIRLRSVDSLPNLYNSDGTLTGGRTITASGNSIAFSGVNEFSVQASDVRLASSPLGDNTISDLLVRGPTGSVRVRTVSSLVNAFAPQTGSYTFTSTSADPLTFRLSRGIYNISLGIPLISTIPVFNTVTDLVYSPPAGYPTSFFPFSTTRFVIPMEIETFPGGVSTTQLESIMVQCTQAGQILFKRFLDQQFPANCNVNMGQMKVTFTAALPFTP